MIADDWQRKQQKKVAASMKLVESYSWEATKRKSGNQFQRDYLPGWLAGPFLVADSHHPFPSPRALLFECSPPRRGGDRRRQSVIFPFPDLLQWFTAYAPPSADTPEKEEEETTQTLPSVVRTSRSEECTTPATMTMLQPPPVHIAAVRIPSFFFSTITHLSIRKCHSLIALDGIERLSDTLIMLDVTGCVHLQSVEPLRTCRQLLSATFEDCTALCSKNDDTGNVAGMLPAHATDASGGGGVGSTATDATGLDALASLPALRHLNVNTATGLKNITTCEEIQRSRPCSGDVGISRSSLTFTPLDAPFPALESLDLGRCYHLSPTSVAFHLRHCLSSTLRSLCLSDLVQLTSLEMLCRCQHLCDLNIFGCRNITSLDPLATLMRLEKLNAGATAVTSLMPLRHLRRLTFLNISHNLNISNLSPLRCLPRLESLAANFTSITSLRPLFRVDAVDCDDETRQNGHHPGSGGDGDDRRCGGLCGEACINQHHNGKPLTCNLSLKELSLNHCLRLEPRSIAEALSHSSLNSSSTTTASNNLLRTTTEALQHPLSSAACLFPNLLAMSLDHNPQLTCLTHCDSASDGGAGGGGGGLFAACPALQTLSVFACRGLSAPHLAAVVSGHKALRTVMASFSGTPPLDPPPEGKSVAIRSCIRIVGCPRLTSVVGIDVIVEH